MPELFEDVSVDEFALPTDADQIALKNAKAAGETPPAPVAEEPEAVETVDEPEAVEDGVDVEVVAEESDPEVEKLHNVLAKFGIDPEQATSGQLNMAKSLRELERIEGERRGEIGDLRAALEALPAQIGSHIASAQPAAPPPPPVQITADLIEQNPGYATSLAYEQGNQAALSIAFEQWKLEDPASAGAWAATETMKAELAAQKAEHERQLRELEARVAPAAAASEEQKLRHLFAQAETANPGLSEFAASADFEAVGAEFPGLVAQIASGSPDQKVEAVTALHQIHRGRISDNLKVTKEEIARQQAETAQQVREDAFVASASTTSSGVKPSKADEIAAEWDAIDAPHRDGWNI